LKDGSVLVVVGSEAVAEAGVTAGLDSAELYGSAGFLDQQPEQPSEAAVRPSNRRRAHLPGWPPKVR